MTATIVRPTCQNENCNRAAEKAGNGKGYRKLCAICRRPQLAIKAQDRPHRKFILGKALVCNHCHVTFPFKSDLEVDHINGNHFDNRDENLQLLCTTCHKAKTKANGDYLPYSVKGYAH